MMDSAASKTETPKENQKQQDEQVIRMASKNKLDANADALANLREQSNRPGWVAAQNEGSE